MDKQATFTEMLNGTAEDYAIIGEHGAQFAAELPDRILEHLSILKVIQVGSQLIDLHIAYRQQLGHIETVEMRSMLFVLYYMI